MPQSSQHTRVLTFFRSPAGLHRAIQCCFLFSFAYVGWRFYAYAQWAMEKSAVYTPKPPSVEAFLPISALLGAKRLLFTGHYDPIHPAGLTIFLMALAVSFMFRKSFCGYLCPVGCLSLALDKTGKRLGISRTPGKTLSLLLAMPKYVLLLFFLYIIVWNMSLRDIESFIRTPYNMVADTKMLLFFLNSGRTLFVALGVLLLGSMLIPSFWCRALCPYGALLGIISLCSPLAVQRNAKTCTGCRRCARACPSRIPVYEKTRVFSPECVGCTECLGACPEKGCLNLRFGYTAQARTWPFWTVAAGTLLALCLFFTGAVATGNWKSAVPPEVARVHHKNIMQIGHP